MNSRFQPETDGTVHCVYLARMTSKFINGDQFLIVAGSTKGTGYGYGPGGGDDEDVFITILDPNTGELTSGRKNNELIGTEEDDFIAGICDDPVDQGSFYIVGASCQKPS